MTVTIKEIEINNNIIILRAVDNHFETWLCNSYGQRLDRKVYKTEKQAMSRFNHHMRECKR